MPNPFRDGSTLHYELEMAGRVTITVHDVAGRSVKTLARNVWREAGIHVATWDGRDDAGRLVAPGVYFERVQALGALATTRVVRVP